MSITLVDFKCEPCDLTWEHVFEKKTDIVNELPCTECGETALRLWGVTNFIHTTHSSMYGKYEPCFGEVVESRSHKQQLLKKYGVVESSDPVKGSRCYRTDDHAPALSALDKDIQITNGTSGKSLPKGNWMSAPDNAKE